jgi:hypothetical protein
MDNHMIAWPSRCLKLLDADRYHDLHDLLEEIWVEQPPGQYRTYLQGLIQLAVCLHHWQGGNHAGYKVLRERGLKKLDRDLEDGEKPETVRSLLRQELETLSSPKKAPETNE